MPTQREIAWGPWVNLIVPGGGLILVGWPWIGWLIGLLFVLSLNAGLALTLLFPDEYPAWVGGLAIGVAAGTYLGAQLRLRQILTARRLSTEEERRNAAIRSAMEAVQAGDVAEALLHLEKIAPEAERDLLVAYRVAQVVTQTGDAAEARVAWERVQRLDRYNLYRAVIRAELARLPEQAELG